MNKSYNYKIISTKKLLNQFFGSQFSGGQFSLWVFSRVQFSRRWAIFKGQISGGQFSEERFSLGYFSGTFSKVKVINKSGKIVAQHKLSFSVPLQTLWIKMK